MTMTNQGMLDVFLYIHFRMHISMLHDLFLEQFDLHKPRGERIA